MPNIRDGYRVVFMQDKGIPSPGVVVSFGVTGADSNVAVGGGGGVLVTVGTGETVRSRSVEVQLAGVGWQ
jgi:hypothetical protein